MTSYPVAYPLTRANAYGVSPASLGRAGTSFVPMPGSLIDLDMLNGRYFGATPDTAIANSNSSGGFALNNWSSLTAKAANLNRLGTSVGLFSEAAATNNQTNASDFSNAVWTKSGVGTGVAPTVTTAFALAPDGTMTANRVQMNLGATPGTAFSRIFSTINTAAASASSVWLKSNDGQNHLVYLVTNGGTRPCLLVTTTWQQFSKPLNSGLGLEFGLSGAAGTDNTADILAWCGDQELGVGTPHWSTSSILTTSAAVTRAADSLSLIGAAATAAAAGPSTIRYLDLTTGYLTVSNFVAGALTFPTNAIIQRVTIYPPGATPTTGANATIYFDGNSLTAGQNATSAIATYPVQVLYALAKLGYSIAPHNVAIAAKTTQQQDTTAFTSIDTHVAGSVSPFIVIFWEVANDIVVNSLSGAAAYANLVTYATNRRASMRAGDKIIVLTAITRGAGSSPAWTAQNETDRLAANALILADTTNWDAVVDVASIPQLQDPTNKTYFEQVNRTHLTDLGYQYVWQAVLPVVRGFIPAPS